MKCDLKKSDTFEVRFIQDTLYFILALHDFARNLLVYRFHGQQNEAAYDFNLAQQFH